jgi:hypothetical protein
MLALSPPPFDAPTESALWISSGGVFEIRQAGGFFAGLFFLRGGNTWDLWGEQDLRDLWGKYTWCFYAAGFDSLDGRKNFRRIII